MATILGFGLVYTLPLDVAVAPWAYRATDGRVHYHDITRFGGTAEEVRRPVTRAVDRRYGGMNR